MGVKVREKVEGSGVWWVFINYKGQRKSYQVGKKQIAEDKALEIEYKLKMTGKMDFAAHVQAPVVFKTYAKKWLQGHVENNLKWNTRRYYADMLARIPIDFQRKTLDEITREDVRAVAFGVVENGLSRATARGVLRTISAIYSTAAEDGLYRGANPAVKPGRILRNDHEPGRLEDEDTNCWTWEEATHFLSVTGKHFPAEHPIYLMALRTGARQGEIVALEWDQIDWHGGFITIRQTMVNGERQSTKSSKVRHVPMSRQLARALRDLQREHGWVFRNSAGGPVDPSKLRRMFVSALRRAGLRKVEFHSLRRTALTAMAENGVPMARLQKIAGHSDITTTARYYLNIDTKKAHQDVTRALDVMDGGTLDHAVEIHEPAPYTHPTVPAGIQESPKLLN